MSDVMMMEILGKAQSLVWPNIVQLVNLQLSKYVNTGDRAFDMVIIALGNGLVVILASAMYFLGAKIWEWYKYSDDENGPINSAKVLAKYPVEVFTKYEHVLPIPNSVLQGLSISYFIGWIKSQKIIDTFNVKNNGQIKYHFGTVNDNTCYLSVDDTSCLIAPVHRYRSSDGQICYIFIYDKCLYSQSSDELNTLMTNFHTRNKTPNKNFSKNYCVHTYDSSKYPPLKECGHISSFVTLDKLHFDEKEKLLDIIDGFESRTLFSQDLCVANKAGILFYGPPGTGKTKCVCAMAQRLQRNIFKITRNDIRSKSRMNDIFMMYKKSHIILFDEIDLLLGDIFREASSPPSPPPQTFLVISSPDSAGKAAPKNTENDNVTLSFLLDLFDGVSDDEDLVVIGTSNDLSTIPPALLRFGRFHFKLKLSYCSLPMFVNIARATIRDLPDQIAASEDLKCRIEDLLKKNITPTILISLCVYAKGNLENLLHHMSLLESKQDYVDYEE